MNYILASASPRRQELLKIILPDFCSIPADIDERVPNRINIDAAPEYLAVRKALAVSQNYPDSLIIGCDTSVIIDGIMLGKPKDTIDAIDMLALLSGREHKVITGCALVKGNKSVSFSQTTLVKFYQLSPKDITDYINTKEYTDKAGGYAVQGKGCCLVEGVYGDYYNVVGLPVAKLKREISKFIK